MQNYVSTADVQKHKEVLKQKAIELLRKEDPIIMADAAGKMFVIVEIPDFGLAGKLMEVFVPEAPKRKRLSRAAPVIDTMAIINDERTECPMTEEQLFAGKKNLRNKLEELSDEQLKDIIAYWRMDATGKAMRTKDREYIIGVIVNQSVAMATRGDAFRY